MLAHSWWLWFCHRKEEIVTSSDIIIIRSHVAYCQSSVWLDWGRRRLIEHPIQWRSVLISVKFVLYESSGCMNAHSEGTISRNETTFFQVLLSTHACTSVCIRSLNIRSLWHLHFPCYSRFFIVEEYPTKFIRPSSSQQLFKTWVRFSLYNITMSKIL